MKEIQSFNALIQKSIIDHWTLDALTDYRGITLQYQLMEPLLFPFCTNLLPNKYTTLSITARQNCCSLAT